jgi:hypothetical protein
MRAIYFVLALVGAALGQPAAAHTTLCDIEQAVKFDYGIKMYAVVWTPAPVANEFRQSIDEFFVREGYFLSSVESGAMNDPSEPYKWDQLPQSPSLDVSFKIETRSDRDYARIDLSTFSFDCGKTEDWKPHWARFIAHLRTSKFPTFLAWPPLFPEVSQIVGGSFNTPTIYARSFVLVKRIAGFFSET